MVGYYSNWARSNDFTPYQLAVDKLTHIHYAFADISTSNKLIMANPTNDLKNFADFRQLKKQNPHLTVLISVGGWDYSKYFSNVAATAEARETFAQSCVDFILEHGLDGIDLDWEFPVSGGLPGNINRPEDKQNFTKLLTAIRSKLDQQSQKDGRPYYLSIAAAGNTTYLNKVEIKSIANLVDYIFLMAYDMHGPWDSYADFNAPLYVPDEPTPNYTGSVSDSVKNLLNRGVPSSKIVLGMPFYGYQYTVTSTNNNGLFSPFTASKSITFDKIRTSLLPNSAFKQYYHSSARVPYLFDGTTFVSYDDEDSIAEKTSLAVSYGLAGVGAWELSQDKNAILLSAAYNALYR